MSREPGQCFSKTPTAAWDHFSSVFCKVPPPFRLLPLLAFNEIMHAGRLAQWVISSSSLPAAENLHQSCDLTYLRIFSISKPQVRMSNFNHEAPQYLWLVETT